MQTALNVQMGEAARTQQAEDELANALTDVLAETYRLESKTHTYHWNIDEMAFFAISKLTEEQYDNMFDAAETLASHMQGLGHDAPTRKHDGHDLAEVHGKTALTTADMMADLATGHERICTRLTDLIRLANDRFDIETGDLAADRLAFHKQVAWMLREIAAA